MTQEESEKMLEMLLPKNNAKNTTKKDFRLSGIIYMMENDWTVWIDDIAYSSIGQQSDFSIDEVSENGVALTLMDGTTLQLSVSPGDIKQEDD